VITVFHGLVAVGFPAAVLAIEPENAMVKEYIPILHQMKELRTCVQVHRVTCCKDVLLLRDSGAKEAAGEGGDDAEAEDDEEEGEDDDDDGDEEEEEEESEDDGDGDGDGVDDTAQAK
jgi:TATA-binding protein-associated factor Taf7